MERFLKAALSLSVIALLLCLCVLARTANIELQRTQEQVGDTLGSIQRDADGLAQQSEATEAGAQQVMAQASEVLRNSSALIARANDKDPRRNTVALANTDLVEARDLIAHADQAANDARRASDEELRALPGLTGQAQGALTKFNALLDAGTAAAAAAQPAEKQLTELIAELHPVAVNTQSITASGARIAGDAADEADKLAHPKKKKLTFWGAMYVGVEFLHKIEPPIL